MLLNSFNRICHAAVRGFALLCAACSLYLFFTASIEQIANAVVMLGAAIALEVIAAVIDSDTARHA